MSATQTASVRVVTHGRIPEGTSELAAVKVSSQLHIAAEPVLSARVTLTAAPDPAVPRPAIAQATVDMNGRIVRAEAAERTMRAAIERMGARLRVRLGAAARNWSALRGTVPTDEPGEWRHQSVPALRSAYFSRPRGEREVMPRPSYAAGPETPDQAAAELDLLDYDFHLFTELSTGQDSVIYRTADGFGLAMAHPKPSRLGVAAGSMTVSKLPAPRLTVPEAVERLEAMGQPFMFFVDPGTGRGSLVYHRYDGHYGLVHPAGQPEKH